MTSSATLLSVRELKLAGLVEHELVVPLAEKDKKRWLFVTPEVGDLLSGKLNPQAAFPSHLADVAIARFCKGYATSLTRKMRNKSADFKKLVGLHEAWAMKLPGPGSGWRLFGRFAKRNVFVGLDCRERGDCAPVTKYNQIALDMIVEWDKRWPTAPLSSHKCEDYVSWPFHEMDW